MLCGKETATICSRKMFKFNFVEDSTGERDESNSEVTSDHDKADLKWVEASEVSVTQDQIYHARKNSIIDFLMYGTHRIRHIRPKMKNVQDSSVLEAESQDSDLIPGKYEGGFKIWECTQDLANFMIKNDEVFSLFHPGAYVLDLGCGAGILGILALLQGCTVHFQDYNESVLATLTIPNVVINLDKDKKDDIISRCRFFSGDWLSFVDLTRTENLVYDVILTSETIYNVNNYSKLLQVFKERLKTTGSVFLAAKSCYFGVGGSLQQFKKIINEESIFTNVCCWTSKEGVQREILQLKFANA